jgi:hypothetical protein
MSSPRSDRALPRAWVDAWRHDRANAREIQGAYQRFLQSRGTGTARPTFVRVAGWVILGVAIGMTSVYAATSPSRPEQQVRSASSSEPTPPASARAVSRAAPTKLPSPPITEPAHAESPQKSLPAPATIASASEQWQRAARGLRESDFATAEAALQELTQRSTGAERDSARLVQAQLLVSQGRGEDAARILRELSSRASSSAVRGKAAELLSGLNEKHPSQCSFAPAEGTN